MASWVSSKMAASLHGTYFKVLDKFSHFGRFFASNLNLRLNKIKLQRIKQLQSRKCSDAKQSRDKAHIAVSDPNTINHVEKIENIQKRMNELKQMMLDLQKNETKESESYPNVSFMSTDNFQREKHRIKEPSALSNAMKGEKSIGAIFIRKKKKTGYK